MISIDLKRLIGMEGAHALVKIEDEPALARIGLALIEGSDTTDFDPKVVWRSSIHALHEFRRRSRESRALQLDLPVRRAARVGEGGTRYYWRVLTADGMILAANKGETRGDLAGGRRKARELFIDGFIPVELIPPDIDPHAPSEATVNNAGSQPDGLTVRQRTKKH
jgi:hypothetical protein